MTIIVTGGAGFIATNLISELLKRGNVVAIDDFSLGRRGNVNEFSTNDRFQIVEHDLSDAQSTVDLFTKINAESKVHEVWHMAANSDIPAGVESPDVDLKDTFLTTHCVLVAMKAIGAKRLYFASSSAVYGDMGGEPVHENAGPLLPISNYGAMKLASEGAISAAVESFLDTALLFRFPNVVGVPATHGVILDFVRKLKATPGTLKVLGDGSQKKSYLHVSDLVSAMLFVRDKGVDGVDVFNIGPDDDGVFVGEIAEDVVSLVSKGATIEYGKSNKGWVGDVPKFSYCVDKLGDFGWRQTVSSREAVRRAITEIFEQEVGV